MAGRAFTESPVGVAFHIREDLTVAVEFVAEEHKGDSDLQRLMLENQRLHEMIQTRCCLCGESVAELLFAFLGKQSKRLRCRLRQ